LDIDLLITVIDKTIRQKRRKVKNTQREREDTAGKHRGRESRKTL